MVKFELTLKILSEYIPMHKRIIKTIFLFSICIDGYVLLSGIWAVINTADVCLKGRIEIQESSQWETLFKTNVFGTLRTARTFYPLLVSQRGKVLKHLSCIQKI